ncbi:MAG: hypothetical protein GX638_13675 [Crenarchaeota archaeon]|nr:hypothetical protein [Thermoproteota archaeon]
MDLSLEEKLIVEVCRMNKETHRKEINKKWVIGKLHIAFNWQSKKNFWGRFSGGWNWNLGFQAGGNTLILNILICSLTFCWKKD